MRFTASATDQEVFLGTRALIMNFDEVSYYTRRALTQLGLAADAVDGGVARVHAELSDLYLERARELVACTQEAGLPDNVVPLRAIA